MKKVHRSKPRNPLIADVCFRGGYIDSWGRGTIKIIEACKDANLPEPVLKEEQCGFLSEILKDRFTENLLTKLRLNERQIKAVEYVKKHSFISNADYQKLNNIGKTITTEELSQLVDLGVFTAPTAKDRGAKYRLN